ncbi:MAG: hypothetical protein J6Z41_03395 [Prevotella sp.]|nr:hypothetical protein [Prevotella sp.]
MGYDVSFIKRSWVWLRRCHHCRGFGIQSPSAYHFVRYVINEHYPYYAYQDLREASTALTVIEKKLCRLYLRIANSCQPKRCVCLPSVNDIAMRYIQRGCKKVNIDNVSATEVVKEHTSFEGADLIIITYNDEINNICDDIAGKILLSARESTIVIIEGIGIGNHPTPLWEILKSKAPGDTFDLYYCGIILFRKKENRQDYIINF